jgi:hypothetical protein
VDVWRPDFGSWHASVPAASQGFKADEGDACVPLQLGDAV